jgi:uncharacterized protein YqgC (DUF456 family)
MQIFLIVIGAIFLIIGFLGSFLPIIPGPPIAFLGLIAVHFTRGHPYNIWFLVMWAVIVIVLQVLDHVVPGWMTKRTGGSKFGIWGSIAGGIIGGILFPPFGIIIGPFAGAFLGEILAGRPANHALKAAWGSFIGFLLNTGLKIIAVGVMAYYFIIAI